MTKRALVLVLCVLSLGGFDVLRGQNARVQRGNALLKEGKAEEALEQYERARKDGVVDPSLDFNRGAALSVLKKHEDARQAFLEATKARDHRLRARAFYNLGNSLFHGEKFGEAVEAYKRSLVLDSASPDAKWNLELALRMKQREDEKKKQDEGQDGDKNGDKNGDKKDPQSGDKKNDQKQDGKQKSDQEQKPDQKPDGRDGQDPQNQDAEAKDHAQPDNPGENQDDQEDPAEAAGAQEDPKPAGAEASSEAPQDKTDAKAGQAARAEKNADKTPPKGDARPMKEIDAILDSLERSPGEIERTRARMRGSRRRPPATDW
jgi:Ca-activated chloride channel family protein